MRLVARWIMGGQQWDLMYAWSGFGFRNVCGTIYIIVMMTVFGGGFLYAKYNTISLSLSYLWSAHRPPLPIEVKTK